MSRPPSLLERLLALVSSCPHMHDRVAGWVADEDASALARLFLTLGEPVSSERIEQLLDEPGPFRPAVRGWT